MSALHRGAALRFEAVIAAALEAAARAHGAEAFGICVVALADPDGRRFAIALHQASAHGPNPAQLRPDLLWSRSAAITVLAPVVAAVLGAELRAEVERVSAAGAVPVVAVVGGVAAIGAYTAPGGSS